jgi:ring-1,2-phenylacetyl-CoA epoxidase subunit PaaD
VRSVVRSDPWTVVCAVADPELPELTLHDLGIVRDVTVDGGTTIVTITPTYTGCPATQLMASEIEQALHGAGWPAVEVRIVLSPPWTTEWITADGRAKLQRAGIGQPASLRDGWEQAVAAPVACPRCGSRRTRRLGAFGSSACREPYVCGACREAFERIKPI